MTFAEYTAAARQYLALLPSADKSPETVRSYGTALDAFGEFMNSTHAEELTPLVLLAWRQKMHEEGKASTTISHYLISLHRFFDFCVEKMGLMEKNLISTEDIPIPKPRDKERPDLDQIKKLLNSDGVIYGANSKTAARNRAIIILLIQTGLRNSELRSLTPADLDFVRNSITVRHGKGDKARLVPFPALSRAAVKNYLNSGYRPKWCTDTAPLFGTDSDKQGHSTCGEIWHQISSAALLAAVNSYTEAICGMATSVHDLRHAYASYCDHMGLPLRDIQLSMGHSSATTTDKIYISVLDKSKSALSVNHAFDAVFA